MSTRFGILFILFFTTSLLHAQFDTGKQSGSFGPVNESGSSGTFTPNVFAPKKDAPESERISLLRENKGIDLSKEKDFVKPKHEHKPAWAQVEKEGNSHGASQPQYLGDFRCETPSVRIMCRDHQYVDGDYVRIVVNGKTFADQIMLEGSFKSFLLTLEPGFNRIEFHALNEGLSSPNTAEFKVIDDNGNTVTHNQWNLNQGVYASIIIFKE